MFYKQTGINCWIAVLSFFPKDLHEVCQLTHCSVLTYFIIQEVKELYLSPFVEVGSTFDLQLKSKQIKISAGKVDGWSCEVSDHKQVYVYYTHVYICQEW